jgi:peptidoglycan/LPS O-acetylase OafA/YrhL
MMDRPSFDSDGDTAAGSEHELSLIEKECIDSGTLFSFSRISLSRTRYINLRSINVIFHAILRPLVPSFWKRSPPVSTHATLASGVAALDGLRGLACLFVFSEHLTYNFSTTFLYGYGVADRRSLVQWPFIRIFWSGFSMVAIFYVISGYVLSYKPLKQIRGRDWEAFHATLSSSTLRRGMRLYIPTTIAVLICGLLVSLGAFEYATDVFFHEKNYLGLHEVPPQPLNGILLQQIDALKNAIQMLNIWNWSDDISAGSYDRHLWTIVVEFRSSMVLFLVLLGTSRMKQNYRLLSVTMLVIFCTATERKDVLLFISGMILAEIDLIRRVAATSLSQNHKAQYNGSDIKWLALFILGLYLCSVPTINCEETPGYRILSSLVPSCWSDKAAFIRSIGAVVVTWSAANAEILRPVFANSFALYLGKISYALYLVHGNVLKTLGYSIMPTIYCLTNDGTKENLSQSSLIVSWILSAVVVVPVTFLLADLFWRFVDMPSVKFARWIELRVSEVS